MELSEVVSAHFAFPVVGVVLCAVLVFAFGFKSPAQPPSFDLLDDDDDRKYKKSRQKKHKMNIDGHVITIDGHGSPGVKVMTKQQTTLNRQAMNEKQDPQITKVKTKKPKAVTDAGGIVTESLPQVDEDVGATGEWTKAVSKKDRKNRSKKDDVSRKDDFSPAAAAASAAAAAAERTSPSHEIQKTIQVTHPTVNIRDEASSNRTQRRTLEVTVTAPAPAPGPVFVSCTAIPAGPDTASVNPDSFSSKVKVAVVSVTIAPNVHHEPQKSVITSREEKIKTSSPASIPKPLQPAPGKGSETVTAKAIQLLPGEDDVKAPSVSTGIKNPTDIKNPTTEDKSSEKCKDSSSATVSVGDGKPARSPKKKKKSPESREKYKESPVVTIPANVTVSSAIVTADPRPMVKPVSSGTPTTKIQTVGAWSATGTTASTSHVQCSPLPSDGRSAEKTCATTADNNLPLSDGKATAGVAHPASDTKTTAGVIHPTSDSKATAGVARAASDSKTTAGVAHPASDTKTTAGVTYPASDNETTAGVTHPTSDSKATAGVAHTASDSKTTAGVTHPASDSETTTGVTHPASDSETTTGVTHPASDTQPVDDLQPTTDNCSDGDNQPPSLTDELGDWQEAKPLKKKRKPHRDN